AASSASSGRLSRSPEAACLRPRPRSTPRGSPQSTRSRATRRARAASPTSSASTSNVYSGGVQPGGHFRLRRRCGRSCVSVPRRRGCAAAPFPLCARPCRRGTASLLRRTFGGLRYPLDMNATHAIVVPFEGLASVVDDLRERTCVSKPSHGMPPHVTLLYPAPRDVEAIAEVLVAFSAFEVVFARLDRFPGTLWLAPEPAERFQRVIEALVRRFPDHPPYD